MDKGRIVPKGSARYVRASRGIVPGSRRLNPVMASGATLEPLRILLGAEIGRYWIEN